MTELGEHSRASEFTLARFERWALPRMAAALPSWVMPDHLTILGILSSTAICAAYVATSEDPRWFWVASLLLVVHWFGDSLDGTLARVRKTERPRYGFYFDHITDAYSTIAVGLGLGLSSIMFFNVGVALVVVYLVMSINVYLETHVDDTFNFGYGRMGPTEGRLVLILLNTVAVLAGPVPLGFLGKGATVFDFFGIACVVLMAALLLVRVAANLRRLAAIEPPGTRRPE